jgi:hypothetical protein
MSPKPRVHKLSKDIAHREASGKTHLEVPISQTNSLLRSNLGQSILGRRNNRRALRGAVASFRSGRYMDTMTRNVHTGVQGEIEAIREGGYKGPLFVRMGTTPRGGVYTRLVQPGTREHRRAQAHVERHGDGVKRAAGVFGDVAFMRAEEVMGLPDRESVGVIDHANTSEGGEIPLTPNQRKRAGIKD